MPPTRTRPPIRRRSAASAERDWLGEVDPDELIDVTLRVRPRAPRMLLPPSRDLGAAPPLRRTYLSRQDFEKLHGSDPKDLIGIERFARRWGLDIVEVSAARRSVVLSGAAAVLSEALRVKMALYQGPGGIFRERTGPIAVRPEIAHVIEGVFGLDDRRVGGQMAPSHSAVRSFAPSRVAEIYDFPSWVDGDGQCIAILEVGGGFHMSDVTAYFGRLGIPVPRICTVSVDGGQNDPDDHTDEKEVMLDIAVAGSIAPGAQVVVYFTPPTPRGFLDAMTSAVHDPVNRPSVLSISWGIPEMQWPRDIRQHIDRTLHEAAALGVTVCCASGDVGSEYVYFPASSPLVLACGGTQFSGGNPMREVVWTDRIRGRKVASSGGVSEVYALPAWQAGIGVPRLKPRGSPRGFCGRGVPDVAANATGYRVLVDGRYKHLCGTSAAAPLWAGLIARINQCLGQPAGYLNPLLYRRYRELLRAGALHDIVHGSNGAYSARQGWDACTGLGRPHGSNLVDALAQ